MEQELNKQAELDKMKLRASALFWFVTLLFVLAAIFEKQYPWLSFVRATAEAAMVGAIADWFAVTALFRHPLHLKIPHTAIIPQRKDIIAQEFGKFVLENFLSEEIISEKIRSLDVGRQAATWISRPENSQQLANHVAVGLKAAAQVVKDEDVQALIEHGVVTRIRSIRFAPLAANALSLLVASNRQQDLLYGTLKLIVRLQEENEPEIRAMISRETPWWLPRAVDTAIYHKIDRLLKETVEDISLDPNHPFHERFTGMINEFVINLKNSPDIVAQEETFKEELLRHPVVQEFSSSLWLDLKDSLLNHNDHPNSDFRRPIQQGIVKFGEALLNDEPLLAKIDLWAEEVARYIVNEYGHEVGNLISETIGRWDTAATTAKIELNIGKDLQFIRINGTLVGGLAGLLIHTVYRLL